jgi:nucleotide-binding universal stress UspA family protein
MSKIPTHIRKTIEYRSVISEGKPAQQIVALSDQEKVDAIIMGPAKGAVTGEVIRAASRPVLAIPSSDSGLRPLQKISKILVTTDFSSYSKAVVDYAFQLKQLMDCELFVLHVIELSNTLKFAARQGYFTDAVSKMRVWAKNQLDNLASGQLLNDRSVHRLVAEGPVSDRIVEYANDYDVNLVVVGAHGYGPVEKYFIGSTTSRILTKLSRPLLVVKM